MTFGQREPHSGALDAGLIHLDTAHGYMRPQRGADRQGPQGPAARLLRHRDEGPGEPVADGRTRLFTAETKASPFSRNSTFSLKRLGLDSVDVLYIHNCEPPRRGPLRASDEGARVGQKERQSPFRRRFDAFERTRSHPGRDREQVLRRRPDGLQFRKKQSPRARQSHHRGQRRRARNRRHEDPRRRLLRSGTEQPINVKAP